MKKLLITENIRTIIEKGESLLSRKDIKIFTALSGEELIEIHLIEDVDLIIASIGFITGGDEDICPYLKGIRNDDRYKKVSILTICENDKSAIEKSYDCGANTFVTKPVDISALILKIIKLINIAERIHLRVIVNVLVEARFNGRSFYANSENISVTGMLFETNDDVENGTKVTCKFHLGKDLITTNGNIVRAEKRDSGKYFYGVEFIELDASTKEKIEKFIRSSAGN
ncbi:MAG: PilZ domain-containing protein [Nitrospirae bacterium]|nr:PilZ domain-containing protein [Nitrospirota bacterium]